MKEEVKYENIYRSNTQNVYIYNIYIFVVVKIWLSKYYFRIFYLCMYLDSNSWKVVHQPSALYRWAMMIYDQFFRLKQFDKIFKENTQKHLSFISCIFVTRIDENVVNVAALFLTFS